MPTPARKAILDNIKTTLEAITVANGYKTTVATVERVVKEWATVGGSTVRPWLGFKTDREEYVHEPHNMIKVTLPIAIVGHVNATNDATRATNLNNLLDDVIAALQSDTRRDSNALHTTIVSAQLDEGDPDAQSGSTPGGSFVLEIEVVYFRTTSLAA